jgi:hypothetical protein
MIVGFYTAYVFGRDYNKMQVSSCRFANQERADLWAEFLNHQEEDKPKAQRKHHFVVQVHDPLPED